MTSEIKFPLNILRMKKWIFIKFCKCIDTDNIYHRIVKHLFSSIMSPPFKIGRHIVFARSSVCPSTHLSVHLSCHSRVGSVTWKPFKIFSWNFIQKLTNIRRHAERKNHSSYIYTFWVMSLWTLLVAVSKTKSCPLCNFKTVQGIFMKLTQILTNIRWGAECKNRNSYIDSYLVTSLWTF